MVERLYNAPKLRKYPRTNKCIILDLDSTLVATQETTQTIKDLGIMTNPKLGELRNRTYHLIIEDLEKPGYGSTYEYWGITRPHLKEFLEFCFDYFKIVGVWSAGQRLYVEAVVDALFQDPLPRPHVIFTYDDVVIGPSKHIEKPLDKMRTSSIFLNDHLTPENTYVLDDTETTFVQNLTSGVLIPAYDPKPTIEELSKDEKSLLQFRDWLLKPEVMNSSDVRTLDKTRIFV